MKRPKGLLLRHKKLLRRLGYNPDRFLYIKETPDDIEFYEISTGKILALRR